MAAARAGRDGAACVAVVHWGWPLLTAPVPTTPAPDDLVPPEGELALDPALEQPTVTSTKAASKTAPRRCVMRATVRSALVPG
jgi:hypothetical protein